MKKSTVLLVVLSALLFVDNLLASENRHCEPNAVTRATLERQVQMLYPMMERLGSDDSLEVMLLEVFDDVDVSTREGRPPLYVAHPCLIPEAMFMMAAMHGRYMQFIDMTNGQMQNMWREWLRVPIKKY